MLKLCTAHGECVSKERKKRKCAYRKSVRLQVGSSEMAKQEPGDGRRRFGDWAEESGPSGAEFST